jgi:tRNA G18 (ribose-2'-O)-methylase SpoU
MTRRASARSGHGWFAIGMERPKTTQNLGTLWRSAACLGASYIFTIGGRYHHQASDTVKSWKHVPYFEYPDTETFLATRPFSAQLIAVELSEDALQLETFTHPRTALYVLGPEDGGVSNSLRLAAEHTVAFQSAYCLNVAAAGTVLMYDRSSKSIRDASQSSRRAAVVA